MSTPSQACRVLGWTRLLGAAPAFAGCWTAVEMAVLRGGWGEGLAFDARLQLVPGVGGLLQALVSGDFAGQSLTEERMEGLAPDSVPDGLPSCPRQLQLLAPERYVDPLGKRLDDFRIVEQRELAEPEPLLDGPALGHRIAAVDFAGKVLDEVPDGVDDLRAAVNRHLGHVVELGESVALVGLSRHQGQRELPGQGGGGRVVQRRQVVVEHY